MSSAACIKVTVVEGIGLLAADKSGFSDPYVKLKWNGKKYKTEVWKQTLEPKWNESFNFFLTPSSPPENRILDVQVKDHDKFSKSDSMGKLTVDFSNLINQCDAIVSDQWYIVRDDSTGKGPERDCGQIRLRISYFPNAEDVHRDITPSYKPLEVAADETLTHFILNQQLEEHQEVFANAGTPVGVSDRFPPHLHDLGGLTVERSDINSAWSSLSTGRYSNYDGLSSTRSVEILSGRSKEKLTPRPDSARAMGELEQTDRGIASLMNGGGRPHHYHHRIAPSACPQAYPFPSQQQQQLREVKSTLSTGPLDRADMESVEISPDALKANQRHFAGSMGNREYFNKASDDGRGRRKSSNKIAVNMFSKPSAPRDFHKPVYVYRPTPTKYIRVQYQPQGARRMHGAFDRPAAPLLYKPTILPFAPLATALGNELNSEKILHPIMKPHSQDIEIAPRPTVNQLLSTLKQLLPQCSTEEIYEAVRVNNYDEDKSYDHLLNNLLQRAAQSHESQKLFSTAVLDMFNVSDDSPLSLTHIQKPYEEYYNSLLTPGLVELPEHGIIEAPEVHCNPDEFVKPSGRRKALLIGINYTGTAEALRGCVADVFRMKKLISKVYGFFDDPIHMKVLIDDELDQHPGEFIKPTKYNMLQAMQWLISGVDRGDVLFFHFSGHGSQKRTNSMYESDGMDETILPSDWRTSGHLTDDELNRIMIRPLPCGAKLTAIMDCCHSGTGLDLPFSWDYHNSGWKESKVPFLSLGDVQLIAGCQSDQTSADVNSPNTGAGGAMTFALVTSLSTKPFGYTYPQLFKRLEKVLSTKGFRQRPQLEASQKFNLKRLFSFSDIVPNTNKRLGRDGMRIRQKLCVANRSLPGFTEAIGE